MGNPSGSVSVTMCPPPGASVSSVIQPAVGNFVALALTVSTRTSQTCRSKPTSPNPGKTPPRMNRRGTPSVPFWRSKRTDQFRSLGTKSDHLFSSRLPFQSLYLSALDLKVHVRGAKHTLKKHGDLIQIRMLVSHMRQLNQPDLSISVDIASLLPSL